MQLVIEPKWGYFAMEREVTQANTSFYGSSTRGTYEYSEYEGYRLRGVVSDL